MFRRKIRMKMTKRTKIEVCSRKSVSFNSLWQRRQLHALEPLRSNTTMRSNIISGLVSRSKKLLAWKRIKKKHSVKLKQSRSRNWGQGRQSRQLPLSPILQGLQLHETHQEFLLFLPCHTKTRVGFWLEFRNKKVRVRVLCLIILQDNLVRSHILIARLR